ncbi:MAG TPA: phosphoribosylanthranilate isomerase [Gammaproteobacteria bacterium]
MFVKICGLTTASAVRAAVEGGADAVGFVFADSPRRVSPEAAHALCEELPPEIIRVAVMRHPSQAEWARVRDCFHPDWLQTDADDFAGLSLDACMGLRVYRDPRSQPACSWPSPMLFEGAESGSGRTADWTAAAAIASRTDLILAGGLDPQNVGEAIAAVDPWGVDVSSGVESSRGRKDPARIIDFIARARAAEKY